MSERGISGFPREFSVTCIVSAFIGAATVGMLVGEPDFIIMLFGAVGGDGRRPVEAVRVGSLRARVGPPVRHGRTLARVARPLRAGATSRSGPHTVDWLALARKRFIAHF
jgi:hypothetical protein